LRISGVKSNGASPIIMVIPSPSASKGFGITNCLISQKIVANAE